MNNPQIQYPEAQPGIQPGVQRKPHRPYQYPEGIKPGVQVEPYPYFPTARFGILPEDLAFLIFVALLSLAIWLWILWRLASKAGYRGRSRWIWFAFLAFPLTGGIALITFCLIPYPIQKQLNSRELLD